MDRFIPLSVPNLAGNELKYTTQAIEAQWVSTGGEMINRFETGVAKYVGMPGGVACQSGTAGLHLSLIALGVGEGDEVIVPTLTFIAAVNPVTYVGAHPVFRDCGDDLCMDPEKLEEFCAKECTFAGGRLVNNRTGRQVKAVIVVHVFGNMANMPRLVSTAEKYNIKLIEDATEAIGTHYPGGKFAGTMGDAGVFSFNGNKIITTGGGGMVVSGNEGLLARVKYLSTQAKDDAVYFIHHAVGFNYRMTNVQAAIGLAQLEQLEGFIRIKKKNFELYREAQAGRRGLRLLDFNREARPNYWFYSLYLKDSDIDRDGLIGYLQERNIQTRPVWALIHEQGPYKNCFSYKIEKAYDYVANIVNIPCSTNLKDDDVAFVAGRILEM